MPERERLRVVQGEARDAASLERAVAGQDAVVSVFGPRSLKKGDLQEVFMRNVVAAMTAAGVKRLVNLSAWGAGDSRETAPFVFRVIRAKMRDFPFDGDFQKSVHEIEMMVRIDRLNDLPEELVLPMLDTLLRALFDPGDVGFKFGCRGIARA